MKYLIAKPYVQWDIYELEVTHPVAYPLDLFEECLLVNDPSLTYLNTRNINNLVDYLDFPLGGVEPFVVDPKDLDEWAVAP